MTESLSETTKIGVGKGVSSLDVSPQFNAYSGVEIVVDEDSSFFAGNRSGRVLTIENAWGSQAQANAILADLQAKGFQYQPYKADGAILNPAAEIGDGITISDTYSGIYTINKKFGRLMKSDISAPQDEEVDHEFPYEPKQDRVYKREIAENKAQISVAANAITAEVTRATNAENNLSTRVTQNADSITAEVTRATSAEGTLRSSLSVQASQISAKVDASGGKNQSGSFSWVLTSSGHKWYANGSSTPVMSVTASGLTVNGTINSTSGKIGGFTIGTSSLYNGISSFGQNASSGVYVGTNGIQLGNAFKVTPTGQVTASNINASNMTLTGTLTIGSSTITADSLRQGAERANSGYQSWDGATSTVNSYSSGWNSATSTVNTNSSYWTGGAGGGYGFINAQNSSTPVGSFYGNTVGAFSSLNVYQNAYFRCYGRMYKGNTELTLRSKTINGTTINYLGWGS